MKTFLWSILACVMAAAVSCSGGSSGDDDSATDADSDTDSDADSDTDTDADTDADADTDIDIDIDIDIDGDADGDTDGDADCGEDAGIPSDPAFACDAVQKVCTDQSTGLMWETSLPATEYVQIETALARCESLVKGGYSDWRLPSIDELRTLVRGCPQSQTGGACGVGSGCLGSSCAGAQCSFCHDGIDPFDAECPDTDSGGDLDVDADADADADADCPGPECPNEQCLVCATFWEGACSGCEAVECVDCFIVPDLGWPCARTWSGSAAEGIEGHAWAVDFEHGRLAILGMYIYEVCPDYSVMMGGGGVVGCVRDSE